MADLQDILSSGDITEIFIGSTAEGKKVVITEELDDPIDHRDFTPQSSDPSYSRGRLYYEEEHEALTVLTDIANVRHNLGQEHLVRVKNVSGSTINNGSVCRMAGSDPVTGFPQAVLAQANTFANALFLGVATHDIPNNTFGFLTIMGVIHDVNTSAFNTNDIVYLSPTVPGGLTKTPTNIVTRVGQVLVVNATTGSILVVPTTLASLPKIYGVLVNPGGSYNLTTSYQNVINYGSKREYNMSITTATGVIVPPNSGEYKVFVNSNINVPTSVQTRKIDLQLWDSTAGVERGFSSISIPRDTTLVSRSFTIPAQLTGGNNHVIRIKADTNISGVTFTSTTFDMESIIVNV